MEKGERKSAGKRSERKIVVDGVEVKRIPKSAIPYILLRKFEKIAPVGGLKWVCTHYPYPFAVVPGSFEVRPPSWAYPHSYLNHALTLKYATLLVIHKPLLYAKAHGITPVWVSSMHPIKTRLMFEKAGIAPDSIVMQELKEEVLNLQITGKETRKWRLLDRSALKWTKKNHKQQT